MIKGAAVCVWMHINKNYMQMYFKWALAQCFSNPDVSLAQATYIPQWFGLAEGKEASAATHLISYHPSSEKRRATAAMVWLTLFSLWVTWGSPSSPWAGLRENYKGHDRLKSSWMVANVPQGSVLVLSNENNTSVVLACVIRRDLLEPNAFVVSQIYISVALLCEEIPSNNW